MNVSPNLDHEFNFEFSKKDVAGKDILDIGCWNGIYLGLIGHLRSQNLVGLDIEIKALQVADKAFHGPEFVQGSIFCLPFKDNTFDVLTLWAVIEHLPVHTELKAFEEMSRILKKGGKLFMTTPNDYVISNLFDPALLLVGHRHYHSDKLRNLLDLSDFTVEVISLKGGFFHAFSQLLFYVSKYLFRRELVVLKKEITAEYMSCGKGFSIIYIRARNVKN